MTPLLLFEYIVLTGMGLAINIFAILLVITMFNFKIKIKDGK